MSRDRPDFELLSLQDFVGINHLVVAWPLISAIQKVSHFETDPYGCVSLLSLPAFFPLLAPWLFGFLLVYAAFGGVWALAFRHPLHSQFLSGRWRRSPPTPPLLFRFHIVYLFFPGDVIAPLFESSLLRLPPSPQPPATF